MILKKLSAIFIFFSNEHLLNIFFYFLFLSHNCSYKYVTIKKQMSSFSYFSQSSLVNFFPACAFFFLLILLSYFICWKNLKEKYWKDFMRMKKVIIYKKIHHIQSKILRYWICGFFFFIYCSHKPKGFKLKVVLFSYILAHISLFDIFSVFSP